MKLGLNALGLIVARVGSDALSLVLFVLLSRHFGPEGTGAYSSAFALATFAFMAVCMGLDSYGVREFTLQPPERRGHWVGELLGTQAAMILLCVIVLAVLLAATGGDVADYRIVVWLTSYQFLTALARTLFIPAVASEKMVWPAMADVLCRALAITTALRIMQAEPTAPVKDVLVGFPIAGALLLAIAFGSAVRQGVWARPNLSRTAISGVVVSLWSFAAAEIFQLIFSRMGLLTVSDMVGDAAAGQFSTGQKLLELSCMPLVLIGTAAYPRLLRLYGEDREQFTVIAMRLIWLMILASGCIAWGIYFLAPPFIIPLFGARFADSVGVIEEMSSIAVVQALESLIWPIIIAAHLQVARFKVIVAATAASFGLHLVLVRAYGIDGAVLATFLSFGLLVALFANLMRRFLPTRFLLGAAVTFLLALSSGLTVFSFEPDHNLWWAMPWPLVAYVLPVAAGFWWLQHSLRSSRGLGFPKTTESV